jgi:Tfp pilus assembly protein PilP
MKRTLTISLLLGLAGAAVAQAPTVVPKAAIKTATVKPATKVAPVPPATVKVVAVSVKPTPAVVKPVTVKPATVKPAVIAVQPVAKPVVVQAQKNAPVASKPVVAVTPAKAQPATSVRVVASTKPVVAEHKAQPAARTVAGVAGPAPNAKDPFRKDKNKDTKAQAAVKTMAVAAHPAAPAKGPTGTTVAVNEPKVAAETKQPEAKKITAANRRDPFVSPVVQIGATGSGCSTGKRCLAIDQVALKGVVRSENGMIAVVVNAMDKAYFLRENDPVFNGYVTKITQDSIVFKETFHDRLGKEATRDVTKTISRPVA